MLVRLMNLPRRIQLGIAAALTTVLALVPIYLALLVLFELRDQTIQIEDLRLRAGKLAALAAMKDQAVKIAATPNNTTASELLIEAANLPIAKANLQSRISAIAVAHNASVSSSGGVPDLAENGLLLIGLRADISGSNEAIEGVMGEIESSKPPLMVREFTLRSEGATPTDRPPTLTASIRLYGATSAVADVSASTAVKTEAETVQP